jgi:hypothetical protein
MDRLILHTGKASVGCEYMGMWSTSAPRLCSDDHAAHDRNSRSVALPLFPLSSVHFNPRFTVAQHGSAFRSQHGSECRRGEPIVSANDKTLSEPLCSLQIEKQCAS